MKVRFRKPKIEDFAASLITVETADELFAAIRRELNLPNEFDVHSALRVRPYKEYVHPEISFDRNVELHLNGYGLIGFCDGLLKTIKPPRKAVAEILKGPFYIDEGRTEHGCCWSSMIMRRSPGNERTNSKEGATLYTECDAANAVFICNALNVAWHKIET